MHKIKIILICTRDDRQYLGYDERVILLPLVPVGIPLGVGDVDGAGGEEGGVGKGVQDEEEAAAHGLK